jgi:glycosyltransferase involved in cell wall biosynthesis
MHASLDAVDGVELLDYIVSFRSTPPEGARRLPIPAFVAHQLWGIVDRPRADRSLDRPSVVHGTNYVVPPARAARLVTVYDCWFLRHPDQAGGDVRRKGKALARAVRHGAVVHASSAATAAHVGELFPRCRVVTVPLAALPVPEPAAHPPIPGLGGRPFVVAIGTLERRKNLPVLVDAFGLIAAERRGLSLVLAGAPSDDRPAIEAAIDRLDPETATRVLLTGRIDEATRAWLLHHALVLAYPSLDEGFGFPLLDAMQVGLPIVASDRGSIPEVCGAAGLLGAPDDIARLAENLAAAAFDDAVRADLAAAAATQLERFSWARCAGDLAALYRDLAGEARS